VITIAEQEELLESTAFAKAAERDRQERLKEKAFAKAVAKYCKKYEDILSSLNDCADIAGSR
jgi:hypothetical protein